MFVRPRYTMSRPTSASDQWHFVLFLLNFQLLCKSRYEVAVILYWYSFLFISAVLRF
jgi:hypothetical protein